MKILKKSYWKKKLLFISIPNNYLQFYYSRQKWRLFIFMNSEVPSSETFQKS